MRLTEDFKKIRKNFVLSEEKTFRIFLTSPVSRIVPKNVKGGTLWDFLNIHSVAKYQKIDGGSKKNFGEK